MANLIEVKCSECNSQFTKEVTDIMEEEKSEQGINMLCPVCMAKKAEEIAAQEPQLKWEYLVEIGLDKTTLKLLGENSWELICIHENLAYFKRHYYE